MHGLLLRLRASFHLDNRDRYESTSIFSLHIYFFFTYVEPKARKNILLEAVKCHIMNEAYVMKKYGLESNITELKGKGTLLRGS